MLLLVDLSMALLLPQSALPPAATASRCDAVAPRVPRSAVAMRTAASDAAAEAAPPASHARRAVLFGATLLAVPTAGLARTPGSVDVRESVDQIRDAAAALRKLRQEWSSYAVIDSEGRAGNIDAARRILGGAAPQRGEAARLAAEATPLYRVDGAFAAIRKFALNDDDGWGARLD